MNPVVVAPQGCCQLRLPFVEENFQSTPPRTYWQMLGAYFSPYFSTRTWSFLLILITFVCLVIPQFFFTHLNKTPKFMSYTALPGMYLSPIQLKHFNHWAIYKCFTTLFFHINYTHWIGNVLGITVNLFTLEYCWCPSILIAILGGTVTSAYAALTMDPIVMGFSGVIACAVGMYFAMFLSNLAFLRANFPHKLVLWLINCVFIFMLLFSQDPRATLVHFIAFFVGLIYGYAWMPKIAQDGCQRALSIFCKIMSIIITILPFVIIFMYPASSAKFNSTAMQPNNLFAKNPFQSFQQPFQPQPFQQFQQYQPFQPFQNPHMMPPNMFNFQQLQSNQWL